MSRPFPGSRWTAVSLRIFWSISVVQQRCIKMTCDRWSHVCDTPRHPRTLVILRLDLHTADRSQASAKQSTGYRHLTEWTLTDKVPEHCSEGSVDFGMIVPLISPSRCLNGPLRPLYISSLNHRLLTHAHHVFYPTLVPVSDRRDNTGSSRGHGPIVSPSL